MLLATESRYATIFRTKLGWMTIVGGEQGLSRLHFGAPTRAEGLARIHEDHEGDLDFADWNPSLVERLQEYAAGERDDFLDVVVEEAGRTEFAGRVLAECRQISPGTTATYGELAARVGSPGAARAVGSVMARNRVPIVIPCHRVVGSNGQLTGFSAPGGCDTKRQMLELEAGSCGRESAP